MREQVEASKRHGATPRARRPVAAWLSRSVLALLILPALCLGSDALSRALFRCEVTHAVHAARCCGGARAPGSEVARTGCCERVELGSSLPAGSLQREHHVVSTVAVEAVAPAAGFVPREQLVTAIDVSEPWPASRMHARAGPSLVIRYRRLLI